MYPSILSKRLLNASFANIRTNLLPEEQQEGGNFKQEFFDTAENTDEDEIKIVRTKKFGIKPMYPEDACIADGTARTRLLRIL